jgi:hypothetical protein
MGRSWDVDSAEDPGRRQEIQLSLKSIVESSDNWLGRLKKRELHVRLASSFLTTLLAFAIVGGVLLGVVVIEFGAFGGLPHFLQQPILDYSVAGAVLFAGLISGIATYFLLKRKHDAELNELSSLIMEMKKIEEGQQKKTNGGSSGAITENAISLADKIFMLLPEIVRKRDQDSMLFGVVAFIIALFGGNFAVAILIGVIVWLYFRYETRKRYEEEISKFEEQKKVFEQRKKDFIETL